MFENLKKTKERTADKTKLVSQDIDFVHEMFELCKNLTSLEAHSWGGYVSSIMTGKEDKKLLDDYVSFSEMRTKYMSEIAVGDGFESWCKSKHILETCMRLQENAKRFMIIGQIEKAKQCAIEYGKLYEKFLKIHEYIQ